MSSRRTLCCVTPVRQDAFAELAIHRDALAFAVGWALRSLMPGTAPEVRIRVMFDTTSTPPPASTLAEIVRRIVAAIDPDKVILFGSRARGDARPDSDYDLLVIKDTTERTLNLEKAAYRAMKGLVVGVDILVETPDRVDRLGSHIKTIFGAAVQEGTPVYERAKGR